MRFWPNLLTNSYDISKEMWKEQWMKYGSCCSDLMSPETYIETAVNLAKSHDMLQILENGGTQNHCYKYYESFSRLSEYFDSYYIDFDF